MLNVVALTLKVDDRLKGEVFSALEYYSIIHFLFIIFFKLMRNLVFLHSDNISDPTDYLRASWLTFWLYIVEFTYLKWLCWDMMVSDKMLVLLMWWAFFHFLSISLVLYKVLSWWQKAVIRLILTSSNFMNCALWWNCSIEKVLK